MYGQIPVFGSPDTPDAPDPSAPSLFEQQQAWLRQQIANAFAAQNPPPPIPTSNRMHGRFLSAASPLEGLGQMANAAVTPRPEFLALPPGDFFNPQGGR